MAETHNARFAAAFAGAFADLGLAGACISPGSRSTPLTLAFEASTIPTWIHHDERSSAFFAVGLARQSDRPVGLICTSGTAAVEYHAAVVEAAQAEVPLVVMTADRPPELRDAGAPQTIDQVKLFGSAVRWFHDAAPPDAEAVAAAPILAARAWVRALESPAGPVHLNLPFREPLVSPPGSSVPVVARTPKVAIGRPTLDVADLDALRAMMSGRRTLHVVGALPRGSAEAVADVVTRTRGVAIADPRSGLRFGPPRPGVLAAGDALATAGMLDRVPPDVVVRWGTLPTSKRVWRWLEQHPEVPQAAVAAGTDRDPLGSARLIVRAVPGLAAAALDDIATGPDDWRRAWCSADETADSTIRSVLSEESFPSEPAVAAAVVRSAPDGGALFAASSMPIRDVDTFGGIRRNPLRVHANRGANGIDGSISTALGVAAAGVAVVALIGDVAALHDVGALATVARLRLPLTVVVVHNDGGGIFEFLPQADPSLVDPAVFERTFGTPHGTDFVAVAEAFGLDALEVDTVDGLIRAVRAPGPRLVQVRTNRSDLAPLRRRVEEAVRNAISAP